MPDITFDSVLQEQRNIKRKSDLTNLATAAMSLEHSIKEDTALLEEVRKLAEDPNATTDQIRKLYNKATRPGL